MTHQTQPEAELLCTTEETTNSRLTPWTDPRLEPKGKNSYKEYFCNNQGFIFFLGVITVFYNVAECLILRKCTVRDLLRSEVLKCLWLTFKCFHNAYLLKEGKMLKSVNLDEEYMYFIFDFLIGLNIFQTDSWEVMQGNRIQGWYISWLCECLCTRPVSFAIPPPLPQAQSLAGS